MGLLASLLMSAAVAVPAADRETTRQVDAGVQFTRIVRTGAGGPLRVNVLAVDPSRSVHVLTGRDRVPGLERVSAMARRHAAIAGINGGYFAVGAPDVGDPTGLVVRDGAVLSEPVGARTALLVPRGSGPVRIAALRWRGSLTAGGASRLVDGVNRNRGRIPACGGVGGDQPTQRIDTATTCTDPSELVVLTPAFGSRTRTAAGGHEAVVRDGAVVSVRRAANTPIPRDGYVLSGSGDAGRFLRDHVDRGATPRLDLDLRDGSATVAPADHVAVLGGAPRLVRGGRVALPPGLEGRATDTGRAPRTIAGVRWDGTILLVTIDGRRPGWSRGATLREAARTIKRLGAAEAVNLDSGGSTAMTVGPRVVNRPSDPGGERPVANGLFVLPAA